MVFKSILYKTCVYLTVNSFNVSAVIIGLINNLISTKHSFARTTALRILVLVSLASMSQVASAQLVKINAGTISVFSPQGMDQCYAATLKRKERPLLATKVDASCEFENGALRVKTYANAGSGVLAVDVTAEVKVIVAHFQVDTPADAVATGYIPVQVTVPVSWAGRFLNSTVTPKVVERFKPSVSTMNMFLRLRETDAADPNIAGSVISQSRFQGASHSGIRSCMSIPTDAVSAASMLAGCALASFSYDQGTALAEINGVIRTNQPYNVELVMRADLTADNFNLKPTGYVPEVVDFRGDRSLDDLGMIWKKPAVVRVGTDAHQVVSGIQEELENIKEDLAVLRRDFDGHYHTYMTGRGNGHNNFITETPPPLLSEPLPEVLSSSNDASGNVGTQTFTAPTTANQASASEDELLDTGANGGSLGIPTILILALLAIRRRSEE